MRNRVGRLGLGAACIALLALGGCGGTEPERPDVQAKPAPAGPTWLTDVTDALGIDFHHNPGISGQWEMPEIMGAGLALADFDRDGRLDLYLIDGGSLPGIGDAPQEKPSSRFFRQTADSTWSDATADAGLENDGYGMGAAVGDLDNDGFLDLLLTNYGRNRLYRNNGDGTFTDVTEASGLIGEGWSTAACFFDYDGDGALDLLVVDYVDYYPGQHCESGNGQRDYCGPDAYPGTIDHLYRNRGSLPSAEQTWLEDRTVESGLAAKPGKGLGVLARDFDGDGRCDLFVANDMQANHLWMQQPDGTFREEALLRGVARNRFGEAEASMGVVSDDLDGDGNWNLLLTHLRGETNTLYAETAPGTFEDVTLFAGLGPPSLPYTGFGVVAFDIELDGDLDLAIANGRVRHAPAVSETLGDPFLRSYAEPNLFFRQTDQGRFVRDDGVAAPFVNPLEISRGLAAGDLDRDGDLDLVSTNCRGRARIFRNDAPRQGHWLQVRLVDQAGNRDAFGSRVTVATTCGSLVRELVSGKSYLSAQPVCLHFGLGECEEFESLEVVWPDGRRQSLPGGSADAALLVVRRSQDAPAEVFALPGFGASPSE